MQNVSCLSLSAHTPVSLSSQTPEVRAKKLIVVKDDTGYGGAEQRGGGRIGIGWFIMGNGRMI